MDYSEKLLDRLIDEKEHGISGGIYNKLQVDFAYNSNHMEGSRLTHEQTRYIFETHTVGTEPARVDDIIETINHFRCFDYILETMHCPVDEKYVKKLHEILKTGTFSSMSKEAVVGDYKRLPNEVGGLSTASPSEVHAEMERLLADYRNLQDRKGASFDDILDFHARYEKIHPFYDGNGRTGRLLMFKECINNHIIPFIIDDQYKGEYNRGLYQWQTGQEKGFLRETCLFMQDHMIDIMKYFAIIDNRGNDIADDFGEH